MSNQLEKLKNSINKEYINAFELNLMKTSGFIPVDKRQNEFFVIINKKNVSNKSQVETLIRERFVGLAPKFIPVDSNDFEEIFTTISTESSTNEAITNEKTEEASISDEPTAEEMLVSIGWLTKSQLNECLVEASRKNIPLDAVFLAKEYLNTERVVSYLKKKYSCNVVLKSQIIVDKSILKMLPEDFVEKKQTVIMSMEGDKLAVAMVNPTDRYTIREVSLSTGRPLEVYAIPYTEYENYLKEYTLLKKSEQHAKETERIIQTIEEENAQFIAEDTLWAQVEKELQDASGNVAKFVYKIITDSIDAKASDIHIEPRLGYYVVRLRSDGILKKVLEIPGSIEQAVITRFKVLARMTGRRREILILIAKGYNNKQIARKMGLSLSNTRIQKWRLYCHLGDIHSAIDAVYMGLQRGLLELKDLSEAIREEIEDVKIEKSLYSCTER